MKKRIKKLITSLFIFLTIAFSVHLICWVSIKIGGYLSHDMDFAMYVYDEAREAVLSVGIMAATIFTGWFYIVSE